MSSNYRGRLKIGSWVTIVNSSMSPRKVVDMWVDIIVDRNGHYETASDTWIQLEGGVVEPYYHIDQVINHD